MKNSAKTHGPLANAVFYTLMGLAFTASMVLLAADITDEGMEAGFFWELILTKVAAIVLLAGASLSYEWWKGGVDE